MSEIGMNPQALHSAGKNVAALKTSAQAAKTGFLEALESGAGAAHHPKLKSALNAYDSAWSKPAGRLADNIETVGNKISNTAVQGVTTDDQASQDVRYGRGLGVLQPQYQGPLPLLCRPITAAP